MKQYIIEWTFQDFNGTTTIEATSSREAMKIMREKYPGFEVDSFAVVTE